MKKSFAMAEVKSLAGDSPNGEFEVILSAATVDRDGEVIDAKAFEPLPDSIPFHAFHDFHDPIGRAEPYYDGDVLKARGVFASTPRAQEIRTLVAEGIIGHTSVGFMAATRADGEDAPHITKGELLEGSFVSVPSNREAAVLMAKSYAKAGARNSTKDAERLQAIHDLAVENGAGCASPEKGAQSGEVIRKAHGLTANDLRSRLKQAVRVAYGSDQSWTWIRDYADEWVVFEVSSSDSEVLYREGYTVTDGEATLSGDRVEVTAIVVYTPKNSAPAPVTPAEQAGKSLASVAAAGTLVNARLMLLGLAE